MIRMPRAIILVLSCACLLWTSRPGQAEPPVRAGASTPAPFGAINVEQTRRVLQALEAAGPGTEDYYFIAVGDIQGGVRTFHKDVFESVARDITRATDPKTGRPIYDQIRFVLMLGDLVYEGPSRKQWEYLELAFAGQGPDHVSYPNIARLVREKAVFPVVGNHELLNFRFKSPTKHTDLSDSREGLEQFRSFFDWDRFIAHPRILYQVPTDLPDEMFRAVVEKTANAGDRAVLTSSYKKTADGRWALTLPSHPVPAADEYATAKARLAGQLAPIFRHAGYGTLPVVNSDNMIAYGIDTGGTIYVVLDSMSRGWHYAGFAGLKKELYPAQVDQHRLNLFSESPYNGQADFFKAVSEYARQSGKTIVPLMHHSVLNGSKSIYAGGLNYNLWLALGLPQMPGDGGDESLYDEILFSGAPYGFSACVHQYESFSLVSKQAGLPDRETRWTISGGGGAPLRSDHSEARIQDAATRYNQRIASVPADVPGRSIAVVGDRMLPGHHYLIVHVQQGQIVDVTPRFLTSEELPHTTVRPQLSINASTYSGTSSAGAALEFNPGAWGLEGLYGSLAFMDWRPSFGVGYVANAGGSTGSAAAGSFQLSPLAIGLFVPRSRSLVIHPAGLDVWVADGGRFRALLTFGVELPVFWDLFGRWPEVTLAVKAYHPIGRGPASDPLFGSQSGVSVSMSYKIVH